MKLINSAWTVIILSLSISLILLSYFFFQQYKPASTKIQYLNELARKESDEANKMPTAKANVKKAIAMVNERAERWNAYVATHTPPPSVVAGGVDLRVNPLQLVTDTYKFRDSIQRAVNTQVKVGGVTVLEPGPYVQATIDPNYTGNLLSSFYHYPDFPFPVVIYDFGTVRVQGTYDQIIKNVRSYKTMPHFLAVADGLRIDGTSPNLTGTYQLSIVGFIRATKIHSAIPEAASAAGATGGGPPGGFGGFPGGGFPGGGGPPTGFPGGIPGVPGGKGGPARRPPK